MADVVLVDDWGSAGTDNVQLVDSFERDDSLLDNLTGIGQQAILGTVEGGTNLARAGNRLVESGVGKLSDTFPETMQSAYEAVPQWLKDLSTSSYAPPTDEEYTQTSNRIKEAKQETTDQYAPSGGLARTAYKGLAGAAELAPKLSMGIGGFALESGLEGGTSRYFNEIDQGTSPDKAMKYALGGGALDTATGLLIPKAIQNALKPGAATLKNLVKELGIFEAFGISQAAGEAILRRYLMGDETALQGLPEQVIEAAKEAPFMLAGLKSGARGAKYLGDKFARTRATETPELEAKMDELIAPSGKLLSMHDAYIKKSQPPVVEPGDRTVGLEATIPKPRGPVVDQGDRAAMLEALAPKPSVVEAPARGEFENRLANEQYLSSKGVEPVEGRSIVDAIKSAEMVEGNKNAQNAARQPTTEPILPPEPPQKVALSEDELKPPTQPLPPPSNNAATGRIEAQSDLVDVPVKAPVKSENLSPEELAQVTATMRELKSNRERMDFKQFFLDKRFGTGPGTAQKWNRGFKDINEAMQFGPPEVKAEPTKVPVPVEVPKTETVTGEDGHPYIVTPRKIGDSWYYTKERADVGKGEKDLEVLAYPDEAIQRNSTNLGASSYSSLLNRKMTLGGSAYAKQLKEGLPIEDYRPNPNPPEMESAQGRYGTFITDGRALYDESISPKFKKAKKFAEDDTRVKDVLDNYVAKEELTPIGVQRIKESPLKQDSGEKNRAMVFNNGSSIPTINYDKIIKTYPKAKFYSSKDNMVVVKDGENTVAVVAPAKTSETALNLAERIGKTPEEVKKKITRIPIGERGAIASDLLVPKPLREVAERGRAFIDSIGKRKEINREIEAGIKDGSILDADEALPRFEKMLRGDVSKHALPEAVKKFAGAYHKWSTFVRTAAERSPEVRKWYEASKDELKIGHTTEAELLNKLQPYIDLADDVKVNKFLLVQRRRALDPERFGKAVQETDANLKKLFNDDEIKAIRSVRTAMDAALEQYKTVQLETSDLKPEQIQKDIEDLRAGNYVPYGRFGNWRVDSFKGGEHAVYFEESKTAAMSRAGEMRKEGWASKVAERVEPKDVPYRLPTEMTEPKGFKKHLIKAELTQGETQELKKSIAEYVVNLAKYSGFKLTAKDRAAAFEDLQKTKQNKTYEWLTKVSSDFHSPTHGVVRGIRNFMYNYYLRFNPGSAIINLTQPATVTYPLLSKITKNPALATIGAYKETAQYIVKGKVGDVGLQEAITRARKEGVIGDHIHRDWLETARSGKKNTISKLIPDMFSGAEYLNRLHGFIAGYKAYKAKGMEGETLYKNAAEFVDASQFQYGKINSPLMARGGLAAPMTFRLWLGNYLSLLGKSMHQGDYGVATRMMATMGAMAGVTGFPFAKDVINIIESQGGDPRAWLKRNTPSWLNSLLNYGMFSIIPEQYRPNITGKVGTGEMVQDIDKGNLLATAGRAFLGATADPILRTQKAIKNVAEGNYGRAAETMLPEGLAKGVSKLYRTTRKDPQSGEEMGFRDPQGNPVMTDLLGDQPKLTLLEKVYTVAGFQPTRLSEAYKTQHSAQLLSEERSARGASINSAIAKALYEENLDALESAIDKAVEYGITPNEQSVLENFWELGHGSKLTRLKRTPNDTKEKMLEILDDMQ
jgi:hypothetical protein